MKRFRASTFPLLVALAVAAACAHFAMARSKPVALPDPKLDLPAGATGKQVAIFAGGCFWGIEAVFEHVQGVERASSGYSGGSAMTARYPLVGTGRTGHAEAVKVVYDPARVSYGQLLEVFFSVAHDPTQLNRQGPDVGPQYRSAIFYGNAEQERMARAYIAQLDAAGVFAGPIVTEVVPLKSFHTAESYHQDYARLHPDDPYIVHNDAPKVVNLKAMFPDLYAAR